MVSLFFKDPVLKIVNSTLVDLPSPGNISTLWNFGSLLSVCLITQILSGLFLALHYSGSTELSFMVVIHNHLDVNFNWVLRIVHANGASMFFVCLYVHVSRGLYYGSYALVKTWVVGSILLLLVMASAFLGYVLPWGQMSFWGATVITSLFSAIPYFGQMIVAWLWGGFSVDNPTLIRFFGLHFILPFVVLGLSIIHLVYLHQTGSSNPLGLPSNSMKISFHYYFVLKDLLGLFVFLSLFGVLIFFYPWLLGDPENFIQANPLVTPAHIQPEWYFLFAYAILRAIPNKLGGVMALAFSVLILVFIPFLYKSRFQGVRFYSYNIRYFWFLVGVFWILTFIGAGPVEEPYIFYGQAYTFLYFLYFFSFTGLTKFSDWGLSLK